MRPHRIDTRLSIDKTLQQLLFPSSHHMNERTPFALSHPFPLEAKPSLFTPNKSEKHCNVRVLRQFARLSTPPPPRVTRLRRRPTRPRHSPTRRSPTHPRRSSPTHPRHSSPTHLRHSRIPRHRSNLCTRSNPRSTRYAQPLLFTVLAQSRTLTLLDPRPRFHIISSPAQGGLTAGDRATAERRMRQREADRKALGLMCGGFLCCLCIGVDRAAVRFGGSLPMLCHSTGEAMFQDRCDNIISSGPPTPFPEHGRRRC